MLILPFVFVTQVGYQEIASHGNNPDYNLRYFLEIIFLLIISQIGTIGFEKLKIPSAPILAAMIFCGFFYTLEITTARFPDIFINIAFVFLGSAIGCRLSGLPIKELLLLRKTHMLFLCRLSLLRHRMAMINKTVNIKL